MGQRHGGIGRTEIDRAVSHGKEPPHGRRENGKDGLFNMKPARSQRAGAIGVWPSRRSR
ncbi:hypothetical protein BURMUCF1_0177, partial [Burkholderia multivorans ATCC BAA-247]